VSHRADVDGTAPAKAVRMLAWGTTEVNAKEAVREAQRVPSRAAWDFAEIDMRAGGTCPIDVRDPPRQALATEAGVGWAYEIYPCDARG
jgi:hypothetical protein